MSESNVAAEQLLLFIERIERLEEEKKGLNDDIKDVYLEAKSNGYDVKTIRAIVRLRKMESLASLRRASRLASRRKRAVACTVASLSNLPCNTASALAAP